MVGYGACKQKRRDYRLIKSARPDRPLPCRAESDANKQRPRRRAADNAAVVTLAFLAEHTLHFQVNAELSDADNNSACTNSPFYNPCVVASPLSATLNSAANRDSKLPASVLRSFSHIRVRHLDWLHLLLIRWNYIVNNIVREKT